MISIEAKYVCDYKYICNKEKEYLDIQDIFSIVIKYTKDNNNITKIGNIKRGYYLKECSDIALFRDLEKQYKRS